MHRIALGLAIATTLAACQPATPPAAEPNATTPAPTPGATETPPAPVASPVAANPTNQATLPDAALTTLRTEVGTDAGELRYFGRGIDLDGDGSDELVAHLNGQYVCGSGGCTTYILKTDANAQWRIISSLPATRGPIAAAASRSNGWRDLIVRVSGGGLPMGEVLVKFDGKRYVKGDAATKIPLDTAGIDMLVPDYESGDEGALLP